jgi:hypothetical protein
MDWFYTNREERSKWLAERFNRELGESNSVLDIGCYNADLKTYLPDNMKYTGIDIGGKPDIILNLDTVDTLSFDDNSFDTVVCADVLEHLENIHTVTDEMCRVSAKYVIITLPNPFADLIPYIRKKRYAKSLSERMNYGKYGKFYGLPLEKPDDRHRWFFSYDEIKEFLEYKASKNAMQILVFENETKYLKRNFIKQALYYILKRYNENLLPKHTIILLKKQTHVS